MPDAPDPTRDPAPATTPLPNPNPAPAGVEEEDMRWAEEAEREQDA